MKKRKKGEFSFFEHHHTKDNGTRMGQTDNRQKTKTLKNVRIYSSSSRGRRQVNQVRRGGR